MQEYESMASRIFHNTMRLVKQRWGEKYTDIQYTDIIPDDGSEEKKKINSKPSLISLAPILNSLIKIHIR